MTGLWSTRVQARTHTAYTGHPATQGGDPSGKEETCSRHVGQVQTQQVRRGWIVGMKGETKGAASARE